MYTFQNIFELKLRKEKYVPRIVKSDNYRKLLQIGENEKRLREEVALRDEIIRDLKNSTSWKITAPLRKISSIFNKSSD